MMGKPPLYVFLLNPQNLIFFTNTTATTVSRQKCSVGYALCFLLCHQGESVVNIAATDTAPVERWSTKSTWFNYRLSASLISYEGNIFIFQRTV